MGSSSRCFFLTLIFIFLQRNRGNLYGISKFKSFATWSYFSPKLHVPTNVILVLRYSISNFGKPLYLTFCNLRILSFALRYHENSHGILTNQIICNLVLFFWVARTNSFYFGFMLEYFKLWRDVVVYFCNLHIISFAVRYRENSHGISKFKSFGTYRMTFNLHNRHFFPQTNCGNSFGFRIFKLGLEQVIL